MAYMKRIALCGGTFDPVHTGHLAVAHGLSKVFALDEVLFIPAYVAPHKRVLKVTPALHRYAMLALATQAEAHFRISTIELDAPERPYTVETLARMQETLGSEAQVFFIMGADSWMEIATWHEWERVLTLSNHIVVARPGYELSVEHVTPVIRKRIVDVRGKDQAALEIEESDGARIYVTDAVNMDVSATAIRQAVREVDGTLPLSNIRTQVEQANQTLAMERLFAKLLSMFGLLAQLLAFIGLYGVMAYMVSQRTHEIGIRMALGANRGNVLKMILKQGMTLTLVGVALGLGGAYVLTKYLESLTTMLYGVEPRDPLTFGAIAALLTLVALVACYIPARRATKVDPLVALRYE